MYVFVFLTFKVGPPSVQFGVKVKMKAANLLEIDAQSKTVKYHLLFLLMFYLCRVVQLKAELLLGLLGQIQVKSVFKSKLEFKVEVFQVSEC